MNKIKSISSGFIAAWQLLLLVGFVSVLLPQVTVVGYRWKVELALAAFLFISLLLVLFSGTSRFVRSLSKAELIWIVLPLALFTLWSGLSCFWAASWRSAMHHTLLWGCYTIFYVLIRSVIQDKGRLSYCLRITGYVVLIISAACVIEFFLSPRSGFVTFVKRYYPYAEINASLLPLLLVIAINDTTRQWIRGMLLNLITWSSVVVIASRTMFIAGISSVLMLGGLTTILHRRPGHLKRWLVFIGLAIGITLGSQALLKADQERALFQRFAGTDKTNVQNARLRLFYWGLAVEGFKTSPIIGIGGDNYFSEYKQLREKYSAANPDNPMLEIIEELFPERAHNEYLQILCELGLVGGLLLGWLLVGIAYMFFLVVRKRASLITLGAFAGVSAFLISSVLSSYSFRLPANGLCFFFLLAVAASGIFVRPSDPAHAREFRGKQLFLAVGLLVSISMIGFSAVRALSINHLTNFQNSADSDHAEQEIINAIALDPSEPMFRSYYGQHLYLLGRYDEAIPQMRLGIRDGLAGSPFYFNLLAAEMRAGHVDDAIRTFDEALRVYPRSVFLRTAYAAFLKRQDDVAAASAEYKRAFEINPGQAKSWQLAHDEGLERLALVSNTDPEFFHPMELIPYDGAIVLSNFQRQ